MSSHPGTGALFLVVFVDSWYGRRQLSPFHFYGLVVGGEWRSGAFCGECP